MKKLKQFINRIKFAPRAIKQTTLNILDSTKQMVALYIMLLLVYPVTIVYMILVALGLYIMFMHKNSEFEARMFRQCRAVSRFHEWFEDLLGAEL